MLVFPILVTSKVTIWPTACTKALEQYGHNISGFLNRCDGQQNIMYKFMLAFSEYSIAIFKADDSKRAKAAKLAAAIGNADNKPILIPADLNYPEPSSCRLLHMYTIDSWPHAFDRKAPLVYRNIYIYFPPITQCCAAAGGEIGDNLVRTLFLVSAQRRH